MDTKNPDTDVAECTHKPKPCSGETADGTESMTQHDKPSNSEAFASLPQFRKNFLYAIISLALAIDVLNTWGIFVAIDTIARDVGLAEGGNAVWIVGAYAMAFAACIPLGGRLCDLFPAQWWFVGGFAGMACLSFSA